MEITSTFNLVACLHETSQNEEQTKEGKRKKNYTKSERIEVTPARIETHPKKKESGEIRGKKGSRMA